MNDWLQVLDSILREAAREKGWEEIASRESKGGGWTSSWRVSLPPGLPEHRNAQVRLRAEPDPLGETLSVEAIAVARDEGTGYEFAWPCSGRLLALAGLEETSDLRPWLLQNLELAQTKAQESAIRLEEIQNREAERDRRSRQEVAEPAAAAYGVEIPFPRKEERRMTELLARAFHRAAELPQALQDELAQSLLEDIEGELRWDETLERSQDTLEKLADEAIRDFKAGRTRKMGFDEL